MIFEKNMANFLLTNLFRIAVSTLNFVSPSIVSDILLHPFDFATILIHIGFNPEGIKSQTATLVSVIVQYTLFTFYIPCLLTSTQCLQFMGMPHPSIFYYVTYIYKKEGLLGCYRGLLPKILERLIMVMVNEKVKKSIDKETSEFSEDIRLDANQEKFITSLINNVCSQFFAVLASHPFHVLMVSSFAEFTCSRKSSLLDLSYSILQEKGYFGFFSGLTARLSGELLSLIFSIIYTAIINKQLTLQPSGFEVQSRLTRDGTNEFVNYVTDVSRFTAFKRQNPINLENFEIQEIGERNVTSRTLYKILLNFLKSFTHNSSGSEESINRSRNSENHSFLEHVPLTSKLFYYITLRDFLSKKISNPFFVVCHTSIILDSGWNKFPLFVYLDPMVGLVQKYIIPRKVSTRRLKEKRLYCFVSY